MKKAIITRYISPTATKSGRVKAVSEAGSIFTAWDHSKTAEQNHISAAVELCSKLDWLSDFHTGSLPKDGYAHVFPV